LNETYKLCTVRRVDSLRPGDLTRFDAFRIRSSPAETYSASPMRTRPSGRLMPAKLETRARWLAKPGIDSIP
jgi:hypothetical protein